MSNLFIGNPEIELIYKSMMHLNEYQKYYEVACFHRSIDILLVHPSGNIVAIEAKISDWKKALHQANTYSLLADYSYILMPQKKKLNPEFIIKLGKHGIGLMLYDSDSNTLKIVKDAKPSKLIFEPARERLDKRLIAGNLDTIPPWERLAAAHV
jgi:hypothetical protein